jgi:uncharacterized protein YeaO (DUF488 family)
MLRTKRWNEPAAPDDGRRILVTRYRPRGVRKGEEPWDEWRYWLGPSRELHADFYGKRSRALSWEEYRARYVEEMRGEKARLSIRELAALVRAGETVTLLCFCADAARCHRSLLAGLIEGESPAGGVEGGATCRVS